MFGWNSNHGFAKNILWLLVGNDKNLGTHEKPVLTFNKALSVARGAQEDVVIKFTGTVTLDKTSKLNGTQCSYQNVTVSGQNGAGAVSEFSGESIVTLTNCAFVSNKVETSCFLARL